MSSSSSSTVVVTAQDVSSYILQMVESYSEPQLRTELPTFQGWRKSSCVSKLGLSSLTAQEDNDPNTADNSHAQSRVAKRAKHNLDDTYDFLLYLLEVTPFLDFLEWRELCRLREVSHSVKDVMFPIVESHVVEYVRPTVDLKDAVNVILKDDGGWPRFVVKVLADLVFTIEKHCRPLGLVPPLIYRVFLTRALVHRLAYVFDDEPLRNYLVSNDSSSGWTNVINKSIMNNPTTIQTTKILTPCPSLKSFDNLHCGSALLPSIEDPTDDDRDLNGEKAAFRELWSRSLPLFDLHHGYSTFSMVTPRTAAAEPFSSSSNTKPQLAYFNVSEPGNPNFDNKGDFHSLKLVLALNNEDVGDPDDNIYTHPGPRGMVLWYSFFRALQIPPFANEGNLSPEVLWNIANDSSKNPIGSASNNTKAWMDRLQVEWEGSFRYNNGLKLYVPTSTM
ncbi:hypothetical protein ACA910_004967 [Epithemia clementina (nom. ined.)]